jgi:type I site-specific restriction endonuclease
VNYYAQQPFYGQKALVFAASVLHAQSLLEKFQQMLAERSDGYTAQVVLSSVESPQWRQRTIDEFRDPNSPLKVAINKNILTAGFDFPELPVIIMARKTQSKSLYLQMKGRGTRLVYRNGRLVKDRFYLIDFVRNTDWEVKEWEPATVREWTDGPDDVTITGEQEPTAREVIPADVEVTIEKVEIIDPFEADYERQVQELREELNRVQEVLTAKEVELIQTRQEYEERLREQNLAHLRDDFLNTLRLMRKVSPLTPVTEEILRQVRPELTLEQLNEAFGCQYRNVEEHIQASLASLPTGP